MSLVGRWQQYARQYGAGGLVQHLLARTIRPVWEHALTLMLVLEPPVPVLSARAPVTVGTLAPGFAGTHEGWAERWAAGHVCYAAWFEGRLVHHCWVSRRDTPVGEIHATLRLGPEEAYVYDCFTDATCRGLGIFPAVLSFVGRELATQGVSRIWIAVEHQNRSSAKAIRKAGFHPAGTVTYRRIGSSASRTVENEPGAPRFHLA